MGAFRFNFNNGSHVLTVDLENFKDPNDDFFWNGPFLR